MISDHFMFNKTSADDLIHLQFSPLLSDQDGIKLAETADRVKNHHDRLQSEAKTDWELMRRVETAGLMIIGSRCKWAGRD